MICYECKENHPAKLEKQPGAQTCQFTECDHCGRDAMCFHDYKVIKL